MVKVVKVKRWKVKKKWNVEKIKKKMLNQLIMNKWKVETLKKNVEKIKHVIIICYVDNLWCCWGGLLKLNT